MPGTIHISMRAISFPEWLEHRADEVPDAARIALVIARCGAAGVSRDNRLRVVRLSPDTLEDLLRALVAAGQVTVVQVNGRRVYRATM